MLVKTQLPQSPVQSWGRLRRNRRSVTHNDKGVGCIWLRDDVKRPAVRMDVLAYANNQGGKIRSRSGQGRKGRG